MRHLFSYISLNWRGQPFISYEVFANLIRATTTRTALKIATQPDTNGYPNDSNNPPAKPGAFMCEPLKAAMRGR